MNATIKQRTFPSAWWFGAAFFWMIVAGILGMLKSWDIWQDALGLDNVGLLPFGRGFLANKLAYIYGWGLSGLVGICMAAVPAVNRVGRDWHQVLWGSWQIVVACGIVSVLAGQGSGIPAAAMAWWLMPCSAAVLIGVVVLLAGGGYGRGDRLSGYALMPLVTSLVMLAEGVLAVWWTGGAGASGMAAVASLRGMIPFYAVVICLVFFLKYCQGGSDVLKKIGLILLGIVSVVFIPFSGLSMMIGWPLPWDIVFWGMISMFNGVCILAVVCVIGIYCSLVAGWTVPVAGGRLFRNAGIAAILLWLIWKFVSPLTTFGSTEGQFALNQWNAKDIFLLTTVGLIGGPVFVSRVERKVPARRYFWMAACLFPFVVCLTAEYAHLQVGHAGMMDMARQNSGWLVLVTFFEFAAWLLLTLVAVVVAADIMSASGQTDGVPNTSPRFSWKVPVLVVAVMIVLAGTFMRNMPDIDRASRDVVPFESLRPGKSAEGSEIYAAEGCGLCHTQIVRRLLNGRDLQQLIDYGRQGDAPYRVSEPQDYDPEMGEGVVQIGYARVGPDLFNLAARAGEYVTYRDADGEERRTATPAEWLMLHLYNPHDPVFGRTWTTCPSMAFLFEKRRIQGSGRSSSALPVTCEPGYEIVPTEKAVKLVDYLLTLKRAPLPDGADDSFEYRLERWSHVSHEYAVAIPPVDYSPIDREKTGRVMQRGKQIFLSRCSVCHGTDGMGDQINYPPLQGSEWMTEKDPQDVVSVIRYGLEGPITVNGRTWDSVMLPPGIVAEKELAPLMTYLLRSFGKRSMEPVNRNQAADWWSHARKLP